MLKNILQITLILITVAGLGYTGCFAEQNTTTESPAVVISPETTYSVTLKIEDNFDKEQSVAREEENNWEKYLTFDLYNDLDTGEATIWTRLGVRSSNIDIAIGWSKELQKQDAGELDFSFSFWWK